MTKTTRSRLAGLDLRILAALATLVPGFTVPILAIDAPAPLAEDTTTETDEDKKKREEKEKDEKAKKKAEGDDDADDKDKDKKPDDQQASASKPKVGLSAKLAAAFAAARSGNAGQAAADLVTARAQLSTEQQAHATTQATLAQRDADLTAARASLESATAQVASLCAYLGVKPADIAGKSAAEITAALDKRVEALAIEQVKGLGFNPEGLPAPSGSEAGETKTKAELRREFDGITDATQRAEFYAKHKARLLG